MQNLKDSELRYRRLFEAAQDGILILDAATGMIEDVNPYLIKMLGLSREEFVKKKIWEVGAFRDIESNKDAFETLQESEYIRYEDLPLKTKDGRLIEVEFVSNVYLVGKEKVIQCNIRDITEQRRVTVALQANEKKYRDLVNQSPDGIFIVESTGNILTVNKVMCRELGFSEQEFLAMNIWDIIPEHYLEQYRKRLEKILAGESFEEAAEYTVSGKDGRIHYIEVLSTPHYAGRDIIGFQGTARDITARKEAEMKLLSTREFLQSVQDTLSAHIAILDHQGMIVQVNSAWRNFGTLHGLKHADHCVGMNYLAVCDSATGPHAEEAPLIANAIREVLGNGKGEVLVEYPCHDPANQRWFVARITNFENNGQKWIVVSHENITKRKVAEQRIRTQLEHLTALSAIDRVIAANFDLKISLTETLTHLSQELEIDAADILILNPNSQMLEYGADCGFRSNVIRKTKIRLGESFAGRAALGRQIVQIRNLKEEPGNGFLKAHLAGEDFICYYGVPLITKGQVKGVLEVFHRTPLEPDEEWLDFLNTLAGQAAIAIENAMLFESLQNLNLELSLAYDATIEGWSRALDLRDKETEGHTQRVAQMTVKLARAFGLNEVELVQVRWGALLHDIGKMGVPDEILHKPGPLTDEEWEKMKKHPTFAHEMLAPIRYLHAALDIPYYHHERWDGSGYPQGLKGALIPLTARIFAVADVWDALSSDRPYRSAWTAERVREYIRTSAGTHFDPQVVAVYLQMPNGY